MFGESMVDFYVEIREEKRERRGERDCQDFKAQTKPKTKPCPPPSPSFPNLHLNSQFFSFSLSRKKQTKKERIRFLLFRSSLISLSIVLNLLGFGFMHFSLGRSTLVSDPSALSCSSGGSLLLFWRHLRFTLAFLLRSLLLTIRLVFCLLFSAVLLILILVG